MKNSIVAIVALIVIGFGVFYFIQNSSTSTDVSPRVDTMAPTDMEPITVEPDGGIGDGAEPLPEIEVNEKETVIGNSIKGAPITAYHYGTGDKQVLFVGGIHGGYSYNTALVAYEIMDYLEANPDAIPDNVRVSVVPVLNPDGLERVTGKTGRFLASDVTGDTTTGRFNSRDVDLNRNFDCEWKEDATWRNQTVSGGTEPFSEPESSAMRTFIRDLEPDAVVVYYSAAGGVYSSSCNNGVSAETTELTNTYAGAAGYQAFKEFDFYEITGDMVNWLAKENIPAISVLLTDHKNPEWSKNQKGVDAVLNSFTE